MRLTLALVASAAYGQSVQNPTSLLQSDPYAAFALTGPQYGAIEFRQESAQKIMRLTTRVAPPNLEGSGQWAVRVRTRLTTGSKKGDTAVARFRARCVGDNCQAVTRAVVERGSDPYPKPLDALAAVGPSWRLFELPFVMQEDYTIANYDFHFWMGYDPQVVEITELSLLNYGQNVNRADLKLSPPYDDSWRAKAEERIERLRKSDMSVRLVDKDGIPIAGAQVRMRMKRHAFGFGSAVAADGINDTSANGAKYRENITALFNKAVLENDLKWPSWEANRQKALGAITWLGDNGVTDIRGHNLIWPSWRWLPQDVQALSSSPDALRARIDKHFEDELSATRGLLSDWDVLNEPYTNQDIQKILGDAEMAQWFKLAKSLDPKPRLFINDYNIVEAGGNGVPHQNAYFKTIQNLLSQNAPVEAIGIQGHFGTQLTPPTRVLEILDRFATFGKPIQITEFDIDIDDEQLQAAYTRDFMTAFFSHPAADAFVMWGFWEGRHWLPKGAMFRRDWTPKPNLEAYRDLVFREWWTDVTGQTDEDGIFATRGFKGDYDVEITLNGETTVSPLRVE